MGFVVNCLWYFDGRIRQQPSRVATFWKGLGVALLVWGVLLLVGAANGQSNPLRPLQFAGVSSARATNPN